MVTDAGRLIRVPVDQVRTTGRQAMGVTLFRVDKGEHVTSVFTVLEDEADENGDTGATGAPIRRDATDATTTRRSRGRKRWLTRLPLTSRGGSGFIRARSIQSPTAIST